MSEELKHGIPKAICIGETKYTKEADIIISACGIPNIITSDMIKDNAVVIDVGVNRINGKFVGDLVFESVFKKASYLPASPGGVGPMTIAMIIDNLIKLKRGC